MYLKNGKAIIKVFTEIALFYFFFQVPIGGGDNADIHFRRFRVAYLDVLSRFEHTKQFGLQLESHFTYFIQKGWFRYRPLRTALLIFHRSGKRTGFMTEYLAFKQIFAKTQNSLQPQSILFAKTVAMDGLCKDFFPVPVSPVSKTVTSVAETFRANATVLVAYPPTSLL